MHTSTCCFTGHIFGSHQDKRGSTLRAWSSERITAFCCTPRPSQLVETLEQPCAWLSNACYEEKNLEFRGTY
jgi:hypothetical protein